MFAVMKDTDYMSKTQFKKNFWEDWRKLLGKNHTIKDLDRCDFTPIYEWHLQEKEKKKQMSSEVSWLKIIFGFNIYNHAGTISVLEPTYLFTSCSFKANSG